jgi:hypothetical protein
MYKYKKLLNFKNIVFLELEIEFLYEKNSVYTKKIIYLSFLQTILVRYRTLTLKLPLPKNYFCHKFFLGTLSYYDFCTISLLSSRRIEWYINY